MLCSRLLTAAARQSLALSSLRIAARRSERSAIPVRCLSSTAPQPMLDNSDLRSKSRQSGESSNMDKASVMTDSEWTPPKDPWDLTDVLESSTASFEQLPEWDPQYVSRTSQERLVFFQSTQQERTNNKGIPTLSELVSLSLPLPDPSLAETDNKIYALQRKRRQYQHISECVVRLAEPRIDKIRAIVDWQEKQDAVDLLFEDIESELMANEEILGKHPSFGKWVERALEEYLRNTQKETAAKEVVSPAAAGASDAGAVPIFMDCAEENTDSTVPSILHPLQPRSKPHATTTGMMVEEWELAANTSTKRIMLRQSTRQVAKALLEGSPRRVLVHGAPGVGKSATLAAIVASARVSGAIVLYLPNGDDLRKNGFYVIPNKKHPGLFDLPVLSKNVCSDMLKSHEKELQSIVISKGILEQFFRGEQLERLAFDEPVSATDLLKVGVEKVGLAPMAFCATVEALMTQDQIDFFMVMDEFNCYFEKGHYHHVKYKEGLQPIPYDHITLFKPALNAMAISASNGDNDLDNVRQPPRLMKRGAILTATTGSHAVARQLTDALVDDAKQQMTEASSDADDASNPDIRVVQVRRYSALEIDHILANYEATGIGKLRLDRGETVRNEQEVARLRMVSGGIGQKLLDACII